MFPKNSKSIVLLAEPYYSKDRFLLVDSKIGGLPLWFTSIPKTYPLICAGCKKEMLLAVQLYEPTDDLDRVLYIFCCRSTKCQLSFKGWACIRQQQLIPIEHEAPVVNKLPAPKNLGLSWSLGSSSSQSGGNSNLMDLLNKMEKKPIAVINHVEPKKEEKTIKISEGIAITDQSRIQVAEMFLDIINEPTEKKPKKAIKVELTETTAGEEGESYDSDQNLSRLLKFNSTIKRFPAQILRIAYPEGQPLFSNTVRLPSIPNCHCGHRRVFEVQLLPTLLSFICLDEEVIDLKTLKDEKEWSSVLIYSCEKNCKNEEEFIVVLLA